MNQARAGEGGRDTASSSPSTAETAPAGESYRPGYEFAAERILEYIAEEGLRPGDRLPSEQRLAEVLQCGRSVTREAVKILSAVGRLTVRKGAGIFIAEPRNPMTDQLVAYFQPTNLEQVLMLFDHRRLIEAETVRRAAAFATPPQVRAIREAAQRSVSAAEAGDVTEFGRQDRIFHDACAEAARNVFLQASVATLREFAQQANQLLFHGQRPGSLTAAGRQHVGVAENIGAGDADGASAAMVEHVNTTQSQFERKIRDRLLNLVHDEDEQP